MSAKKGKREVDYRKYPERQCMTFHHCEICEGTISLGQFYCDGGYGRRAHSACVLKLGSDAQPDRIARKR